MTMDIPVKVLIQIGDSEPIEIGTGGIPWPYDAPTYLAGVFRDAAEEMAKRAST